MNKGGENSEGKGTVMVKEKQCVYFKLATWDLYNYGVQTAK